jgi:uncharacterized protein (DUF2235 family)
VVTAFIASLLAAAPYGALVGVIFGPLRLAGVDFGKWFRSPVEISEGNDRTWIGLTKQVSFRSGRIILAIGLLVLVGQAVTDDSANGLLELTISDMLVGVWRGFEAVLGLLLGAAISQAALEGIWRWGLRRGRGPGQSRHIRRARPAAAAPRAAANTPATNRRRLVVCCDGTWNSPAQVQATNVVHLLRSIKAEATINGIAVPQIAYYHLGVGTGNFLDRFLGGGAGIGLSGSVKAVYGFLADNFRPSDEILLFGFSRGAYVVRSVAGMIGLVGLLQKEEMFRFYDVWDYYARPPGQPRNSEFLDQIAPKRYCNVEISCVGVWDTVGALGIPGTRVCASTYAFHETSLGPHVRHAFQALAIDEQRGNFQPAVWGKSDLRQVLEQVWFPGVHSNIGGGYKQHGLSDTTLLWMLERLGWYGLLDFDVGVIDEAIQRSHAERPPTGKLQDSRRRFWKAMACAIPRPVGITDDSEAIHQSAIDRRSVGLRGDVYDTPSRRDWLETIPKQKIWPLSDFERDLAFQRDDAGDTVPSIVRAKRGLCDRCLRWAFGQN